MYDIDDTNWYLPYAIRPNLHHRSRGKLHILLPQRPYSHKYRHDKIHPDEFNIVGWVDTVRFIRWYRSSARTTYRKIRK